MTDNDGVQQFQKRRQFFADHYPAIGQSGRVNVGPLLKNTCPACGFPTLGERAGWEICAVCFWEDDGQDDADADEIWGGPNGHFSLTEHRLVFANEFARLLDNSREHTEVEALAGQALMKLQSLMDTYSENDKALLSQHLEAAMVVLTRCGIGR
jgi:hypothetical protein